MISEETRNKIKAARARQIIGKRSLDTRLKMSLSQRGKKHSEETKNKLRLLNTGTKYSKETNLKKGRVGKDNHNWAGGRYVTHRGYVRIRVGVSRYVYEHRYIMEKFLKRKLKRGEVIHHKNKDTSDNRIENLTLFGNQSDHLRHHSIAS